MGRRYVSIVTAPTHARLWPWVGWTLVVWTLSTLFVLFFMPGFGGSGGPWVRLPIAVMAGAFATFWIVGVFGTIIANLRSAGRKKALQDVVLKDATLTLTDPVEWKIRLREPHDAVVELSGTRAAVCFLRPDEDVWIHCDVSSGASFRGAGDRVPLRRGSVMGSAARSVAFGEALLKSLDEHRDRNSFLVCQDKLRGFGARPAAVPDIVPIDSDEERAGTPYRESGRPVPGDPEFEAWLEREGLRLSSAIVLSTEHLVARCNDGVRRAFPLGLVGVERHPDRLTLRVTLPDGRPVVQSVTELDCGVQEALVRWTKALAAAR